MEEERYPKVQMCDCGTDFLHAYLYTAGDVTWSAPFFSREGGRTLIEHARANGALTEEDVVRLTEQSGGLPLPETEEVFLESLSDEDREIYRKERLALSIP